MSWLTSEESVVRYSDALKRIVSDDADFNHFRRDHSIREIIEGVPDVVGFGYHGKLKDTDFFKQNLVKIQENDKVGDPRLILIEGQPFASTTLRYAWNVHDMNLNGVQLDEADIVEIGGGYGGLARMIHAFHTPKSYTIIDLPEALALAKRFLEAYDITANYVSAYAYDDSLPIDTFISNYALTEHTRDVQTGYVEKFLKRARTGYVTFNSQPRNAGSQYSLAELQGNVLTTSKTNILQENVKRSECQVLVWTTT